MGDPSWSSCCINYFLLHLLARLRYASAHMFSESFGYTLNLVQNYSLTGLQGRSHSQSHSVHLNRTFNQPCRALTVWRPLAACGNFDKDAMLFRLLQMARYTGLPGILQEIEIIGKTVGEFWELWEVAFSWPVFHRELEYGMACHKSFWCPKDTRALVRRSSGHCLGLVYLFPLQWAHYYWLGYYFHSFSFLSDELFLHFMPSITSLLLIPRL